MLYSTVHVLLYSLVGVMGGEEINILVQLLAVTQRKGVGSVDDPEFITKVRKRPLAKGSRTQFGLRRIPSALVF